MVFVNFISLIFLAPLSNDENKSQDGWYSFITIMVEFIVVSKLKMSCVCTKLALQSGASKV